MPVLVVKCSQGGAVLLSMVIGFLAQISHVVLMGILIDKNKATAQPIVPVDLSVPYGSLIVYWLIHTDRWRTQTNVWGKKTTEEWGLPTCYFSFRGHGSNVALRFDEKHREQHCTLPAKPSSWTHLHYQSCSFQIICILTLPLHSF